MVLRPVLIPSPQSLRGSFGRVTLASSRPIEALQVTWRDQLLAVVSLIRNSEKLR